MPRPVVVASDPTAVALEPNGLSGSFPSPVRSASCDGSCSGASGSSARNGAEGRLGFSGLGGAASTICGTNTPDDASRFAA